MILGSPLDEATDDLTVSSPVIQEGGEIPDRYTCHGEGNSPPLQWSGVPPHAESIAVVVDDPQAAGGPKVHWVVYNLDPDIAELPENGLPSSAQQAENSVGEVGYDPPCPDGSSAERGYEDERSEQSEDSPNSDEVLQHYRFTVYALQAPITLEDDDTAELDEALGAIAARSLAWGRLLADDGR
ncbi:YbhB/YbcL family Raf kinase inhibitor-like protein [Lipingzhangella sp. LS1_29]|uniref:YbhB/YbcL family Raf kinase inhibitor-like protein n=1 Tax=Lipingzhangella rawalii TaxID=2055835 RepID=A0ABU2H0I3_9ACTN|nr:YbhB/YbcL family Raf kinase inhibitor-like protein [Lipingzhangella rawalii]MDS1268813.1 YbhB/YbcL family Raf kinase inhibitor-like protein [Lipingzhangella rawalii]